jgi:hypothetical protein
MRLDLKHLAGSGEIEIAHATPALHALDMVANL